MKDIIKRTPLSSKKFIFAMICNVCWLGLIGIGIIKGQDSGFLTAMVYAAGLVQSLYIGGQSAVDAFVRKAFAKTKEAIEPVESHN